MTTNFLYFIIILQIVLFSCKPNQEQEQKATLPNIIVFLVDDMGLMDTSVPFMTDSVGQLVRYPLNEYYQTPNMEKLAESGIRFTNFYAHSVCSPSRATLLTGQNAARHRTTNWIRPNKNNRGDFGPANWNWKGLDSSMVTLPRQLQAIGYKTIHIGKGHFGPKDSEGENPLNLGFDINIAGNSSGQPANYYGEQNYAYDGIPEHRKLPGLEKYHGTETFLTEALTLEANAAISKAKEENKPFFLYMAHYAVHAPLNSDPRFAEKYKASGKSEKAQAYATLIEGIDKSLGDISRHVKSLGLGENTLILFLGDNGSDAPLGDENGYTSSAPLRGKKAKHWEGGMRVPFIASWVSPDENAKVQEKLPIVQNGIQEQIGTVEDIFPTLSDLAAFKVPKDYVIDGFSLNQQLNGKENTQREKSFLNHFPHSHRSSYFTSFVQGDWKVIYHYPAYEDTIKYELYHLKEDPFEVKNMADENPSKLNSLLQAMNLELEHHQALYPEKDGRKLEVVIPNKN